MATTPQWLFAYLTKGIQPNGTNSANMSLLPARDPRENEDCLFLDIFAPKTALDNVKNGTGAPVMVEIHGSSPFSSLVYAVATDKCARWRLRPRFQV